MDPLRLAVRVVFIYVVGLAFMRIAGHREVKQTDTHSFVIVLIIGDLFDDLMWVEIPAAQFVVAMSSLFLVHMLASLQWFRSGRRTWPEG